MESGSAVRRTRPSIIGPTAYVIAALAFRISLVAMVLAMGYLLYGLLSGSLAGFTQLPQPERVRVLSNVGLASQALYFSVLIAAVSCTFLFFQEAIVAYLMAALGAALYFGIPFLYATITGDSGGAVNVALRRALMAFPDAAWPLIGLGGLLIARDVVLRLAETIHNRPLARENLRYGGDAQPETAKPIRLSPLGKCWEGPFCREFIRTRCPVFLQRQACWRVKRGCYCEEEIVSGASTKITGVELNMAPDPVYNFGKASAAVRRPKLTDAQKRERCRECVIYNEHQRAKYQLLLPVTLVGMAVLFFITAPMFQDYMRYALTAAETIMNRFSFSDASGGGTFRFRTSATVEWIFIGSFMIIVMSKVLQMLEWAIFKIKI